MRLEKLDKSVGHAPVSTSAPAPTAVVQRKLTVGAANDTYEREADVVAAQVVAKLRGSVDEESEPVVRRLPASYAEAPVVGHEGGDVDGELETELRRTSGGSPLGGAIRRSMDDAIGADFSNVRVHTDSDAAARIGAKAFTYGNHVHFAPGAYAPGSVEGQQVLAHELTHTVQQGAAPRVSRSLDDRHDGQCGCASCSMSSSAAPTVQRKLANTYTSTAIKAAGHEVTYFISKSTFAKLLDSLDTYFLADTPERQFTQLAEVQTRITAFLNSKSRTKTRKGSDATKEAAKVQLVNDLQRDVRAEMDDINATPTGDLLNMHMATSHDTVVMVVAKNLADMLGTDTAGLAAIPAATLRARFIQEVYVPQAIEERGGRKAQGTLNMAEQLEQIRAVARVDVTKLTPNSEAATLFALFELADIDKSVKMASDPRFGTGSEEFTPAMKGWDPQKAIKIQGGDPYRATVIALLDEIAQTSVGQALLSGIGGASTAQSKASTAVHSQNKSLVATVKPPSVANANFKDANSGDNMYANSASGTTAAFDHTNTIIGDDPAKAKAEQFRQRDAVIGLFHELVHVYLGHVNEPDFTSTEHADETMSAGQMYEPRVAGIRIREVRNGKTCTFPFDDPAYSYVSENTFRKEYAALKGESDYYVRPYYLGKTDEVRGPTDKQKV